MTKKVKSLGRKGTAVYAALSSKGDKTYTIYKDGEDLTCECIGFSVRKSCRHIDEYLSRQRSHREHEEGYRNAEY
jgi:hypothetical protein